MTDLLDLMREPPVTLPVFDALGVIQGEIDETLRLTHPRMAWDRARIELHRHTDGLWMWSVSFHADGRGSGYRVGPKWGHFAKSREDALHWAVDELLTRLESVEGKNADLIRAWARGLA
ncbi:hypothetical protein [Pukyongiella litopenaei]|uniref:Uncharacterized protein n=1 Tax=Pukyongiella litopenaei TaxID=2605946 RepID=A0A2S0MNA8_9RHOB|nr:hypothetical protein [Pukyongiella litopenaei]AVO37360.1 hypothetical protein C6Y53_06315 [Pukyongiella litopenaei]